MKNNNLSIVGFLVLGFYHGPICLQQGCIYSTIFHAMLVANMFTIVYNILQIFADLKCLLANILSVFHIKVGLGLVFIVFRTTEWESRNFRVCRKWCWLKLSRETCERTQQKKHDKQHQVVGTKSVVPQLITGLFVKGWKIVFGPLVGGGGGWSLKTNTPCKVYSCERLVSCNK